jgi:hypothetical protein
MIENNNLPATIYIGAPSTKLPGASRTLSADADESTCNESSNSDQRTVHSASRFDRHKSTDVLAKTELKSPVNDISTLVVIAPSQSDGKGKSSINPANCL